MTRKVSKVPNRTEPFWRRFEAARGGQRVRLMDWWQRCRGSKILVGVPPLTKQSVRLEGKTLRLVEWTSEGFLRPKYRQIVAWHYGGYLVVSKRAPKWVRNWALRDLSHVIEVWAPLTRKVVRECVHFQKGLEKVQRVKAALLQPPEEFPF